jgi:C-terminal processing protease CtpA/Prc
MRRAVIILAVCFGCAVILTVIYSVRWRHSHNTESSGSPALEALTTHPLDYAKSRITGGVGVLIVVDTATGLPRIHAMSTDSPALNSGLREGDIITKVDGLSTTGRPLMQVTETIRGFSAGSVRLSVVRGGSTNLDFLIRRTSWSSLSDQRYNPYE